METAAYQNNNNFSRIHPKVFALWVGMCSIVMAFAGLTSAYIVRKGAGEWINYKLPDIFWISTIVIVLSSVTLQMAYSFFKKDNLKAHKIALGVSLGLGFLFLILQYAGWQNLADFGIRLQGNPSGAFLYVISGLHAAHILGGIVILFLFFTKSLFKKDPVENLLREVNPNKMLGHHLLLTYWHFIGILWVYLFVFFWYNSL